MRVLSLFSGIGAFEKSLNNLKTPFDLVNFSEIDKPAEKSYCAIHGMSEDKNLGDISRIKAEDLPKDIDLITYGFPCQDISNAGKQKGFVHEGETTRSGLFYEALRVIETVRPKIAIAENVKNLTSKRFKKEFEIVLNSLEEAGYTNHWKVLNAKDYGIPQNRDRVFIVSIRNDIDLRFSFPEPFKLEKYVQDFLEDQVDVEFYISNDSAEYLGATQEYKIPQATKKGFIKCSAGGVADLAYPNSKTRRGRVQEGGTVCPTITATSSGICKLEPGGNSIVVNVLVEIFKELYGGFEHEEVQNKGKQPVMVG